MSSQCVITMVKMNLKLSIKKNLPKVHTGSTEQESNSFHDTLGEESGTQTALWYVHVSV